LIGRLIWQITICQVNSHHRSWNSDLLEAHHCQRLPRDSQKAPLNSLSLLLTQAKAWKTLRTSQESARVCLAEVDLRSMLQGRQGLQLVCRREDHQLLNPHRVDDRPELV
jgi:hypothetical protein